MYLGYMGTGGLMDSGYLYTCILGTCLLVLGMRAGCWDSGGVMVCCGVCSIAGLVPWVDTSPAPWCSSTVVIEVLLYLQLRMWSDWQPTYLIVPIGLVMKESVR